MQPVNGDVRHRIPRVVDADEEEKERHRADSEEGSGGLARDRRRGDPPDGGAFSGEPRTAPVPPTVRASSCTRVVTPTSTPGTQGASQGRTPPIRSDAFGGPLTQLTSQGPSTVIKSSAPSSGVVQAWCFILLGM